jgi:hypothetical protein
MRTTSRILFMTRIMLDSPCAFISRVNTGFVQVQVLTDTEQRDLHYRKLVQAVILAKGADGHRSTTIHEVSDMVQTPRDDDAQGFSNQVSSISFVAECCGADQCRCSSAALLICCCVDGNSIFQVILCGTMWGLNRYCGRSRSFPGC